MDEKITAKRVSVTPQMADRWLKEKNPHNRKIYESLVETYALEMKRGNWLFNPQPIIFDDQGNLIDGQHRLLAVNFSGKTIDFLIVKNTPKDQQNGDGNPYSTQMVIDLGKPRGTADQLHLGLGWKNANAKAAICSVLVLICTDKARKITPFLAASVYEIYKKEIELVWSHCKPQRLLYTSVAGGAFAFAAKADLSLTLEFIDAYFSGENLGNGSPILLYRNFMLNRTGATGRGYIPRGASQKRTVLDYSLTALMHYHQNNKLLKFYTNEKSYDYFINKQKRAYSDVRELFRL